MSLYNLLKNTLPGEPYQNGVLLFPCKMRNKPNLYKLLNQNTNFVLLRFIAALSDKSTTAEAVHYQKREKGECAYYCAQCEAEVFNVLFAKEDPIHKK